RFRRKARRAWYFDNRAAAGLYSESRKAGNRLMLPALVPAEVAKGACVDTPRIAELRSYWDGRVERELTRERDHPIKQVHTDLVPHEIARGIGARRKLRILDAGAGTGRFSLPLAQAGHRVTHLDLSPEMLAAAQERAAREGVTGISFAEGSIEDLSRY